MSEFLTDNEREGASTIADAVAASSSSYSTAGSVQRQAFLRSASVPTLEGTAPKLKPRWLFAEGKTWVAFSPGDSKRLEAAKDMWRQQQGGDSQATNETPAAVVYEPPEADASTDALPEWRVPVGLDRMYDVDLRRLDAAKMFPVFWKGPAVDVRRGEWFFENSRIVPCEAALSHELEDLYRSIRPWTSAYADELKASASISSKGEEKLMCKLKSLVGSHVIFSGSHLARIYQEGVSTRLTKTLLTAWSGEHGGGTVVVRGYDQMQQLMRARKGDSRRKHRSEVAVPTPKETPEKSRARGETTTTTSDGHQSGPESPLPPGVARPHQAKTEDPSRGQTAARSTDLWSSLTSRLKSWNANTPSSTKAEEGLVTDFFKKAQSKAECISAPAPIPDEVDVAADATTEEDEDEEVFREREADEKIEVIFAWHGIGQKLAEDWKNLDFSLAVNSLKDLVRKRSQAPAPSVIGGAGFPFLSKGKRLLFVPINWRATLNDFKPTKDQHEEYEQEDEHLDNRLEIDDLFGMSENIPLARQITKNLLLDIPLYLSHHRSEVLRRAIVETNRAYALVCQRHPNFKKRGGQVSMICHSLGCVMACDVLSKQPTRVDAPTTSQEILRAPHLAFDVRSLYFCGSPAALFFYLGSRQLIARRGREFAREDAPKDESLARNVWGCLAVDRIWNVINTTDPLATHLNGCVDAKAKATPLEMDRVVNCILATLPGASTASVEALAAASGIANAASTTKGASFFGNWSPLGKGDSSAAAPGHRSAADDGSTTPPADLEEIVQPRKRKGEGAASVSKAKAQSWAVKVAQRRAAAGSTYEKGGDDDAERADLQDRGRATGEAAGKKKYSPSPIPPRLTMKREAGEQIQTDASACKGAAAAAAETEAAESDARTDAKGGAEHDRDPSRQQASEPMDRARRRFLALNPLGRVDYALSRSANWMPAAMLEYVQMLQSHANYWRNESFADFILATIYLEADDERWAQARRLLQVESAEELT